jgi:hypothetical protein
MVLSIHGISQLKIKICEHPYAVTDYLCSELVHGCGVYRDLRSDGQRDLPWLVCRLFMFWSEHTGAFNLWTSIVMRA